MDKITIAGIAGYDGEYPIDLTYFTNKELHTIKRLAGVRAGEIQDALAAGDNDVVVAFTVIALERNGKALHEQVLWDAKVGAISIEFTEPDGDDDPPTVGPEETASDAERTLSSGPDSATSAVSQGNGQSRTGLSASELSPA